MVFAAGVPAFFVTGRLADRFPLVPLVIVILSAFAVVLFVATVAAGLLQLLVLSAVLGYVVHSLFPAMDTYLLTSARIAGTTPEGEFIVDDPREGRIHRFAPEGTHLDVFGRKGNGPGELGQFFHFTIVDSTRLEVAAGNRVLRFSFEGAYLGERRPEGGSQLTMLAAGLPNPVVWEGQRAYISNIRRSFVPREGETTSPYDILLQVVDDSFLAVHSIVDSTLDSERIRLPGNRVAFKPFDTELQAAAAAWQPVAWNWGPVSDRIDLLDTATMERRAVIIPWSREPVAEADREKVYSSYSGEQEAAARARIPFPDTLPPIDVMMWDGTGRLWVVHYQGAEAEAAGEPRRATVLDAGGRWLFDQHLPAVPDRIEGERFFLNTEDEEGQPVVEVYRLVGTQG